ncbi:MAG: hypothetical protein J6D21_08580 [Clostridia bacterium]|nr:hypothetical protein [Clostridia bacterium]
MKRLLTVVLSIILALTAFTVYASAAVWNGKEPDPAVAFTFSGGNGTADSPYRIATAEDLAQLAANVNDGMGYEGVYFVLTADIVLNETSDFARWGTRAPANRWTPIGFSSATPFRGSFDGKNHTVKGLYLSTYIPYAGLFGYVNGGSISNLHLEAAYVSGADYVGALSGYVTETVYFAEKTAAIQSCTVEGYVHGSRYVGGLVGYTDVNVTECIGRADVSAERFAVGGLVGVNEGATVSLSYATGSASGPTAISGGIVGKNTGTVDRCYNMGQTYAISMAGGIVGYNSGTVQNSYNMGPVAVTDVIAGGIVGENAGTLTTSYSIGAVKGTDSACAVVGKRSDGTVESCFYLDLYGMKDSSGTRGLSRSQMKLISIYTDFDFSGVWTMGPSRYPYPILKELDFTFTCSHTSTVVVETPCTCEEDGAYQTVCTVCGAVTASESIAGGHDYVLTKTEEPTCTKTGFYTYTCIVCENSYRTPFGTKAPHTMQAWVTTKVATCTETGARYRTCQLCDHREDETVPTVVHAYDAKVIEPQCTEVGYTEHTCIFCGDSYRTDEVVAKGHSYSTKVTAPTCIAGGYTEYTCTVCGEYHVADEVTPNGHTASDWVILSQRTFTNNGVYETHCTVCGIALERVNDPAYGFLYLGIAIAVMGVITLIMIFVAAGQNRKKEYYASLLGQKQEEEARVIQPFEIPQTDPRPMNAAPILDDEDEDDEEDAGDILFTEFLDDDDEDDDDDDDDWL